MTTVADILTTARSRANEGTPYAGAVTPQEAYELLQRDAAVKLIDVRTNAERDWVGRVDIADTQHGAVQWATYPGGVPNPDFIAQLAAQAGKDEVLLFLCRSGVRSRHAAKLATEHGYLQLLRHPGRLRRRQGRRRPPQADRRLVQGGLAVAGA